VHHSSSLEFRAELILLMVMSDGKIGTCEERIIKEISKEIYGKDVSRARLLLETIHEFHEKVVTKNGLEYTDLIIKISNDVKRTPRFVTKINIDQLERFRSCLQDEEDLIFHDRIIEFLTGLKSE